MVARFHRLIAANLAALLLAGLLSSTALAAATSFTSAIRIDLTGEVVGACSEPVMLSGSIRDVLHVTERADGSLTFAVTTHPAGMFGTGVLVVTHYLGLSGREAAGVLGVPPGTVKSRLHHATRAMRAAMTADERATLPQSRSSS